MLDLEGSLHAKLGAFFDCKGFGLERLKSPIRAEVDGNVRAAFNFQSE